MAKPKLSEVVRLGQDVYNIKHSVSKREWRHIVRGAHKRGLTVRGALSNAPDPLKERTKSSLRDEATSLIGKLYKPQEQALDSRTQQINAVDRLRAQDNAKFNEWLSQQTSSLQTAAKAADEALAQRVAALHTQVAAGVQANQTQANANAAATPGTVSNTADSNALKQLAQAGEASKATNTANSQQALTQSNNALSQMNVAGAAMLAETAVNDAKRQSDTWQALADVSDDKTKLKLSKAADAAKMVQDLLAQEISKAQYNQDTSIAADKLGVETDKLNYQKKSDKAKLNLEKKKYGLDKWKAQHADSVANAKVQLGYDKIKADKGQKAADRALDKKLQKMRDRSAKQRNDADNDAAAERGKDGNKPPTGAEKKTSSTLYRQVNHIKDQIVELHKRYPKGKSDQGKSFRAILYGRGYDSTMVDIAEDLRKHNGKLSSHGIAKAKNVGILNPEQLWGV